MERLLGKLNAVLATHPGSAGRSVADRDNYPAERRARLRFADLERCVALAVIDHNQQQNAKTLKTPVADWARLCPQPPRFEDDPSRVVLAFLPGAERRLTPQGVSLFALDYYSSWLGVLVPRRDRLSRLEVRLTPRHQPHLCSRSGFGGVSACSAPRWTAGADNALGARSRPRASPRPHARSETQKVGTQARDRRDRGRLEALDGRTARSRAPVACGRGQQAARGDAPCSVRRDRRTPGARKAPAAA